MESQSILQLSIKRIVLYSSTFIKGVWYYGEKHIFQLLGIKVKTINLYKSGEIFYNDWLVLSRDGQDWEQVEDLIQGDHEEVDFLS